jgi:hypothetical protein
MPRSVSTPGPPPEATVYYVDENLGPSFASHLRMAGLRAEFALDFFKDTRDVLQKDVLWLPHVANSGMVIVTNDKFRVPKEQAVLLAHGGRAFVLTGKLRPVAWAAHFVELRNQKRIRKLIASRRGAFVARFYPQGEIRVIPEEEILSRLHRHRDYR